MLWLEHHKVALYSGVSATCFALAGAAFLFGIGGPTNSVWLFVAALAAGMAFGVLAHHNRA